MRRTVFSPSTWVHPRVCGEAAAALSVAGTLSGPSPRVRGSPAVDPQERRRLGSIPACAGKPWRRWPRWDSRRVHPRVCGEAPNGCSHSLFVQGPSPRVRGSRRRLRGMQADTRSIPACAGKPPACGLTGSPLRVHPRVCGEAEVGILAHPVALGPSPRVRGSPQLDHAHDARFGSIPACAGKPDFFSAAAAAQRVHPRVCGEAVVGTGASASHTGPSPRVRGSPDAAAVQAASTWSIPACAGKPPAGPGRRRATRVHPRVCGEAAVWSYTRALGYGPSPRVRGSLDAILDGRAGDGSIPACAGKPSRRRPKPSTAGVHPRVCGEADGTLSSDASDQGPSPRVRGSRSDGDSVPGASGSIPACAGKPIGYLAASRLCRVHPRVCGEARGEDEERPAAEGPSPRVRGSLDAVSGFGSVPRSIPACAGKPTIRCAAATLARVHPRVCGEAYRFRLTTAADEGPSPRVRGSPHVFVPLDPAAGSIPACAGKPAALAPVVGFIRVHPRVCGEAYEWVDAGVGVPGPSPRVRGSPCSCDGHLERVGSIPACAGKPRPASSRAPSTRVHPRVCGEANVEDMTRSPLNGPSPRVRGSPLQRAQRPGVLGSIPACAGKPAPRAPGRCLESVHPRVCGEAHANIEQWAIATGPSPRVRGSRA